MCSIGVVFNPIQAVLITDATYISGFYVASVSKIIYALKITSAGDGLEDDVCKDAGTFSNRVNRVRKKIWTGKQS